MSILNLEVKIRKIKIKTNQNKGICFSLRLGKTLSSLSAIIENQVGGEVSTNIALTLGCEQALLASNSRASLVIYEAQSEHARQIVGMVFVMLKNHQFEFHTHKIQQSSDPDSFIQLSFSITPIELKQKQNESLASKSSLAEIRELHRVLSKGHKKSISDISFEGDYLKKSRLSSEDKQRELKHMNSNKIMHLKSEESCKYEEEADPHYSLVLKKLEEQLSRERQRNSILINLLVVEEEKNTQSEDFIKRMLALLQVFENIEAIQGPISQEQKQLSTGAPDRTEVFRREPDPPNMHEMCNQANLETLLKERDQLYTISHELYEKTKFYKRENEDLLKNVKLIQSELKLSAKEANQLRAQNTQLRRHLRQYADSNQNSTYSTQIIQLKELTSALKTQNAEYQRKFKESFRALEQFKNDAWKAQQQVIRKDQQISILKADLQIAQGFSKELLSKIQEMENNQNSISREDPAKMAFETFKLMSALLMKNNLQKERLMEELQNRGETQRQNNEVKLIEGVKNSIQKVYQDLGKQNKKIIHVVEMRTRIAEAINSIIF